MELGLEGRVALVTAASRGLGQVCARILAMEGARVAAAARSVGQLEALAREVRECGRGRGELVGLPLDLAEAASISAAVEEVVGRWGRIDVLVANAPGPPAGPFTAITVDQWSRALEMNVLAMVRLVHVVVPLMQRQRSGRIFFITTIGVRTAQPEMVLSNATRLAVLGMAKTMAIELAPDNILVNVLAPGPIATERMAELIEQTAERGGLEREEAERVWLDEVPLGRMGQPEDLATLVALLSSERCSYVTGAVIPVDGGKARGY